MARIKRGEKVKHLCARCVEGRDQADMPEEVREWLKYYWVQKPISIVKTEIHVANVTPELLKALLADPNEIYRLTPEAFEELICDRLREMGYSVVRVGGHSYRKDGGIDVVAYRKNDPFPFLLAVQIKHHRAPTRKTGPGPVRELRGVVQSGFPFNAGVLVTNTTFTPDAHWAAAQTPMLVLLRDMKDIQRWLEDNFLDEYDWREIPEQIEVCPGVTISIPKPKILRLG